MKYIAVSQNWAILNSKKKKNENATFFSSRRKYLRCVATIVFNLCLLHAVAFSNLNSQHENAKEFQCNFYCFEPIDILWPKIKPQFPKNEMFDHWSLPLVHQFLKLKILLYKFSVTILVENNVLRFQIVKLNFNSENTWVKWSL